MMASKPSSRSAIDQHDRFVETARALGCDENEAAFDEKLKVIVVAGRRKLPSAENQVTKPRDESDERSAADQAAK